jgi:hypothetical protein
MNGFRINQDIFLQSRYCTVKHKLFSTANTGDGTQPLALQIISGTTPSTTTYLNREKLHGVIKFNLGINLGKDSVALKSFLEITHPGDFFTIVSNGILRLKFKALKKIPIL